MFPLFHRLPQNILECFKGRNLVLQILAFILTYIIVITDFDWRYFEYVQKPIFHTYLFPAVIIGFIVPIIGTGTLYLYAKLTHHKYFLHTIWALAQASFLGWLISSSYKALTGRVPPDLQGGLVNISRDWNFGFWEHGIFWGWPSSHTAVAFSMAFALIALYPRRKNIAIPALLYAFYIGLGVSIGIHWFSEFVAGAIIGSVIGMVVGNSFRLKSKGL